MEGGQERGGGMSGFAQLVETLLCPKTVLFRTTHNWTQTQISYEIGELLNDSLFLTLRKLLRKRS